MAKRYRLKLSKLHFCSLVDDPAQPNAKTLLIKRAGNGPSEVSATAKFVKSNDELGLAFFWAFTSTNPDGTEHFDLHNDTIDQDFVKAAMDWALEGGAVDEMHDGVASGARTVFAMPMDPEIAKIYGLTTKQSGLMIAIKPTPEQMAKLKDGTYSGVSIGGLGQREQVQTYKSALFSRVLKEAVLTSEDNGHQHAIDIDDPATSWSNIYTTSYQTEEGADAGHSHAWTFDVTTGAITIAADSGHAHTVDAMVSADALAAWVALDAAQDARNAEVAADAAEDAAEGDDADDESGEKTVNVFVSQQAPHAKWTRSQALPQRHNTEHIMANENEKIVELTKRAERAERLATLTDAQRALFKSLGSDGDAYLAKSFSEREAVVADIEKSNVVVYTSKSTGETFRSKDDVRLVTMAKRQDDMAIEIAKRDEAIEKADIRKAATEALGGVAGEDEVHDYIVKAIRKGGGDAAMIEKSMTTLKSVRSFVVNARKAKGSSAGDPSEAAGTAPADQLDQLARKYATDQKVPFAKAYMAVLETDEGRELYAAQPAPLAL